MEAMSVDLLTAGKRRDKIHPSEIERDDLLEVPEETSSHSSLFPAFSKDVLSVIFQHLSVIDMVAVSSTCKELRQKISNDLWKTKLTSEVSLCPHHFSNLSNCRQIYLNLCAKGRRCGCKGKSQPLQRFVDMQNVRVKKWLETSTIGSRRRALEKACQKLSIIPLYNVDVVSDFVLRGKEKEAGPAEIAAVLKATIVSRHKQKSEVLLNNLGAELKSKKFRHEVSFGEAALLWYDGLPTARGMVVQKSPAKVKREEVFNGLSLFGNVV
jgi:hypothetical protein